MIEKQITEAALQQAKSILDNKDFWGGPSAAKTSADTIASLVGISQAFPAAIPETAAASSQKDAKEASPPVAAKTDKKDKNEPPATDGESKTAVA